jgi:UDP-N-acetylmuramyl tripeptide synthase
MTTQLSTCAVRSSFGEWAFEAGQNGLHPMIYVVGTRGKSTVARLLDTIARESGLRTALRTDSGVEIEGKRQMGDIHPLVEALECLDSGELDLAIIEMDWSDLHTLPVGDRQPGAVIVSTICPHKEYCLLEDTKRAIAGLKALLLSTPESTMIAADIDDAAFPSLNDVNFENMILTTVSETHPSLRRFLGEGGLAAWTSGHDLVVGSRDSVNLRMPIDEIPVTLDGAVLFQMRNVMLASSVAAAIGIPAESVRAGLLRVQPDHANLPTSLNSFVTDGGIRVLIDRPSPSWFLGPLLRAARGMKPKRTIYVVDYRDMPNHDDSVEVGRMIGRNASMCVMINDEKSLASVMAVKAGMAQNDVPPPIAHVETLPKAIQRALSAAREDDLIVVLTNQVQTVYRSMARHRVADSSPAK